MCGIAGIIHPDTSSQEPLTHRMLDRIRHRGPDHNGVWSGRGCVLGHARLSIIDLSETGQIVRRVGLSFPVLYSSGDARPPLAYAGLMDGGTHPFPGTYVIGKDGQIHYEFVGRNYIERAPIGDVINVLRQLAD